MNDFITLKDKSVVVIRSMDDIYVYTKKALGEEFTNKLKSLMEDYEDDLQLYNDVGAYAEDLSNQEVKMAKFRENVAKIDKLAKQADSLLGKTGLSDKQLHNFFATIISTMEDIIHG